MNFARIWTVSVRTLSTGFENRLSAQTNPLDPMAVDAVARDYLPKATHGGYIGDGYPLCTSMPERSFLRKGATFSYRGYSLPPDLPTMQRTFIRELESHHRV